MARLRKNGWTIGLGIFVIVCVAVILLPQRMKEEVVRQPIHVLKVQLNAESLEILPSEDEAIHIQAPKKLLGKQLIAIDQAHDEILIRSRKFELPSILTRMNRGEKVIILRLPKRVLEKMDIQVRRGNLYIKQLHARDFQVAFLSGKAVLDRVQVHQGRIHYTSGHLHIRHCQLENVKIEPGEKGSFQQE